MLVGAIIYWVGRCLSSKVHLGRICTKTFQKLGALGQGTLWPLDRWILSWCYFVWKEVGGPHIRERLLYSRWTQQWHESNSVIKAMCTWRENNLWIPCVQIFGLFHGGGAGGSVKLMVRFNWVAAWMDETAPLEWLIQLVMWDDWNTGSIAPGVVLSFKAGLAVGTTAPHFSTWVALAVMWASKVCPLIPGKPRQCKQSASIRIAVSAVYYCFYCILNHKGMEAG